MDFDQKQVDDELGSLAYEASRIDLAAAPVASPEGATAASEPQSAALEWKEVLQPVLFLGFGVLAPNWGVSAEEIDALTEAYAPVLNKYFPDSTNQFGPEIVALMTTSAIILPRLRTPRKLEPVKEPEPVEAEELPREPAEADETPGEAQVSAIPEEVDA